MEPIIREDQPLEDDRPIDPPLDRRSGEERRKDSNPEFFAGGGIERRRGIDPRRAGKRAAKDRLEARGPEPEINPND
jgi:hypothetical protein